MRPLIFGSGCSGIEAASEAFLPLGWECDAQRKRTTKAQEPVSE